MFLVTAAAAAAGLPSRIFIKHEPPPPMVLKELPESRKQNKLVWKAVLLTAVVGESQSIKVATHSWWLQQQQQKNSRGSWNGSRQVKRGRRRQSAPPLFDPSSSGWAVTRRPARRRSTLQRAATVPAALSTPSVCLSAPWRRRWWRRRRHRAKKQVTWNHLASQRGFFRPVSPPLGIGSGGKVFTFCIQVKGRILVYREKILG